jgi:hypothetical protein
MTKLSNYIIVLMLMFQFSGLTQQEEKSKLEASVNSGYTSNYLVNGLAKTDSQFFAGFDVKNVYYNIDTYVGAVVLDAGEGLDELHANFGVGKEFDIYESFAIRADAQLFQHQVYLGANSTEARLTLSLENKYITPYALWSYDVDTSAGGLRQEGYIIGLKKDFCVFGYFNLTPSVEHGSFSDYETFSAKVDVSKTLFEHLELFGQVGFFDNDFDVANYNFAVQEFDGDLAASAGVRWQF